MANKVGGWERYAEAKCCRMITQYLEYKLHSVRYRKLTRNTSKRRLKQQRMRWYLNVEGRLLRFFRIRSSTCFGICRTAEVLQSSGQPAWHAMSSFLNIVGRSLFFVMGECVGGRRRMGEARF